MKVPMGFNNKLITINKLSNYQIDCLLNDDISNSTRANFKDFNISLKEARLAAYDIKKKRNKE